MEATLFGAGHKVTPQIAGVRLILSRFGGPTRDFIEASAEDALIKGLNPLMAAEKAMAELPILEAANEVGLEARPAFYAAADATVGTVAEKIEAGHQAVANFVAKKKAAYKAARRSHGQAYASA